MKKTITHLLASIALLLFASITSFAQTFEYAGISYNITSDTTVEVTSKFVSYEGNIEILSTAYAFNRFYSVTRIGERAFASCSALTNISIPNTVTSIGEKAFRGCSALTSITIPSLVTSIEAYTFYDCKALTDITIPDLVTKIGDDSFTGCSALTSITIPNSITSIGNSSFFTCTALTSINIPNSVTSIGDYAFSSCSSLSSITIPNSVTSIGNYAFFYCSMLNSVTVESKIPLSIQNLTFTAIASTATLYVPSGTLEAYEMADVWKNFTNKIELNPTGIETINASNLSIFPNPAKDLVTVTLTESVSGTVSIVDLQGNVVATKSISGNTSNISTAELASGVYVVKISTNKGVAVKQLVVE